MVSRRKRPERKRDGARPTLLELRAKGRGKLRVVSPACSNVPGWTAVKILLNRDKGRNAGTREGRKTATT